MSVKIIDTLKPKNNGSFPIVEAVDVAVNDELRLPEALEAKADAADLVATNDVVASKANTADLISATAELQGEIDQIVISASSEAVVAPEVAAARVDAEGKSFQTLKDRLDADSADTQELSTAVESDRKGLDHILPHTFSTKKNFVADQTIALNAKAWIDKGNLFSNKTVVSSLTFCAKISVISPVVSFDVYLIAVNSSNYVENIKKYTVLSSSYSTSDATEITIQDAHFNIPENCCLGILIDSNQFIIKCSTYADKTILGCSASDLLDTHTIDDTQELSDKQLAFGYTLQLYPTVAEAIASANAAQIVKASQTDFITKTKNLCDINDENFVSGGYYNDQGVYVEAPTLCQSGFIPVIPGENYTSDYHNAYVLWYDSSHEFVYKTDTSVFMENGYVTAPSNAVYAKFIDLVANIATFQVEKGTTPTAYEAFGLFLDSKYIRQGNVEYDGLNGVAFGTSLTYRAQTTGGYLQYLPALSGIQFDNQGIGGATILQYESLGNILAAIKSYTSYANKDICIIEGFVNDWVQNHDKLGEWTDNDETTVCGCVRSAITYILTQNPDITLFLVLDHYGKYSEGYGNCSSTVKNQSDITQYEYYEEIAKVAESLGIHVVKEYAESGISELTPQYILDNIHPTALGAEQSANIIWRAISQWIPNIKSSET